MLLDFGREICGEFETASSREWLVTNGNGSYASGTIAGVLTRRYHGLLVAALKPPLGRTLLLSKLEETALYGNLAYPLSSNYWASGNIEPQGYKHIERFYLEGTIPGWRFACGDALLEKRVWMQPGANTTYVRYDLVRGSEPLSLSIKALVNYRDYHGDTHAENWQMAIEPTEHGLQVTAFEGAVPLYLLTENGQAESAHEWYRDFELVVEQFRGLSDREDHLHAGTFHTTLKAGESFTFVASTEPNPNLDSNSALNIIRTHEQELMSFWQATRRANAGKPPEWIQHLILAADQFIVTRPLPDEPTGKTIIAGYHWFGDWGRDTMISLPGLTLSTGRPDVARPILRTFARYVNQGMLPNRFPDAGEQPEYNTVDATLWYFEAIRAYYAVTGDDSLLGELFPVLADIVDWHTRGTRYNIHLDPADGLLYAGTAGVQLTWMDAKIGDWVVTPRIGKPIEINALWYNALRIMAKFAQQLHKPHQEYEAMAERVLSQFSRFWNEQRGYCYDVLDSPNGNDDSLRPNQIFAVSLPESPLTTAQQQRVVDACAQVLLTSHGLRSLAPNHPEYQGHYGGDQLHRDSAYHQGTVWAWLIGPFVLAYLRIYKDAVKARTFLEPFANHLHTHGLGNISEIFEGDVPLAPRGCIAQAWSVAEVLRAWVEVESYTNS